MNLGKYFTIQRALDKADMHEGIHYRVVTANELMGQRAFFGGDRLRADLKHAGAHGLGLASEMAYSILKKISPLDNFIIYLGISPILDRLVIRPLLGSKEIERKLRSDEIRQLKAIASGIGKNMRGGLREGPATHIVATRYGSKFFLLNREAARALLKAKPRKVVRKILERKQW